MPKTKQENFRYESLQRRGIKSKDCFAWIRILLRGGHHYRGKSTVENDDDGECLLVGVCLKYTSLPSSAGVTCDREFVINTSPRFFNNTMSMYDE